MSGYREPQCAEWCPERLPHVGECRLSAPPVVWPTRRGEVRAEAGLVRNTGAVSALVLALSADGMPGVVTRWPEPWAGQLVATLEGLYVVQVGAGRVATLG